jgi:hypothetical protein
MDIKNIENKLKKYISKLYNLHITQNYDTNKYNIYLSKTIYYYDIIGGKGKGHRNRRKSRRNRSRNNGKKQEEGEDEGGEDEGDKGEDAGDEGDEGDEAEGKEGEKKEDVDSDDDEGEINPKIIKQNIEKFEKEIYEVYDKFLELNYEKKVENVNSISRSQRKP